MIFSDTLITALQQTSNQIAGDAETSDPEEVAELCVDADRMAFYGHKEAQEEASRLIGEFGYGEFLKEAAKHVYC
jgi:hypothetical protein